MNIEKIKNYNQKLLAVLGTIIALLGIVVLILFAHFTISEIRRDLRFNRKEGGILSGEKVRALREQQLRQQLISFEMPKLIDTLNAIYIIPVSHKSLDKPEYIETGLLNLLDYYDDTDYDMRYSKDFYGSYNNIIVYDSRINKSEKLFTERVNFGQITTKYFHDDVLIIVKAANDDTNRDGVINLADHRSLYVYSLKEKNIRKISVKGGDIYDFKTIGGTKDLIVMIGLDRDKDGTFNRYKEPSKIKRYAFNSGVLVDIIDEKLIDELQSTLDAIE